MTGGRRVSCAVRVRDDVAAYGGGGGVVREVRVCEYTRMREVMVVTIMHA
jgi:hypothetical protein